MESHMSIDHKIPEYDLKMLENEFHDWEEFNHYLLEHRIKEIVSRVQQGPVLDVGCGTGEICKALHDCGYQPNGIDPNRRKIIEAMEKYPEIPFKTARLEDLHYSFRYHTIVCSHVVEHVSEPFTFLKRCYSLLHPSGTIIVTVPNALSLHKRIGDILELSYPYKLSPVDKVQEHKHTFNLDMIKGLIKSIGFTIVTEKGLMLKPFPSAAMNKYLTREYCDALFKVGQSADLINYCSSLLIAARKF